MSFTKCLRMAQECSARSKKKRFLKQLHFALRLYVVYPALQKIIDDFFAQNLLRSYIISLPEFRRHLYAQQVRSCFYRKSSRHHRRHFLQSHFNFLESTHQENTIKQFYTDSLLPFVIQQGDIKLSFKMGYKNVIAREGLLYLTVEMNDLPLYKVTFWFSNHNEMPTLFIGGFQGGQDTLEANRLFTKELWGLRPQNMVLTVLRWYAQTLGITQIFTFSKDKFWCKNISEQNSVDAFWQEQGALPVDKSPFISISSQSCRKDINEIATRKRSMYKKRYDFLDRMQIILMSQFEHHLKISQQQVS